MNGHALMDRRMVRVAAAVTVLAASVVWNVDLAAAEYSEEQILSESEETALRNDQFGSSVALSGDGDTAIVGIREYPNLASPGNDNQGSAMVFTRSGGTWTEQQTLTLPNGDENDQFGEGVALSADGDTAIVSAPAAHFDDGQRGPVTVFTRSGGTWTVQQILKPQYPAKHGHSVALSANGDTVIIGSTGTAGASVWTRSGGTWTQQQVLEEGPDDDGDAFGDRVALSADGNTALVGGKEDSANEPGQGSATVFTLAGGTWIRQQKIYQSDGTAGDRFGISLALSADGDTAIVGAHTSDPGGNDRHGSATVFTRSGGTWTEQQTINESNGRENAQFGISVALTADGDTAIVGAYLSNPSPGAHGSVTVFTRSGGIWTEKQTILPGDADTGNFGISVALSDDGGTALVGAIQSTPRSTLSGSATVFDDPTATASATSTTTTTAPATTTTTTTTTTVPATTAPATTTTAPSMVA